MRKLAFVLPAVAILTGGCEDGGTLPEAGAVFVLEVTGEEFRALVTDAEAVADLQARLEGGTEGVVSGTLATGDGGFNAPWNWHWVPGSVHTADFAVELCDGRPSMVENDLDYWVYTVKQFCPWGATVVRREH